MDKPKSFRLYPGISEEERRLIQEYVYFHRSEMSERDWDEFSQEARDYGVIPPKKTEGDN